MLGCFHTPIRGGETRPRTARKPRTSHTMSADDRALRIIREVEPGLGRKQNLAIEQ